MLQKSPLTDEHRRLIDHHLAQLQETAHLIKVCEDCGIPMHDLKSDHEYLTNQLTAIKHHFFGAGVRE